MLHLRLSRIAAAPAALQGCVRYIETEIRPAVAAEHDSLGLSLLASPESGVAVLQSFWASHYALRASEAAAASTRDELARRAGGTVTDEQYRIEVFEREDVYGQEAVRLTRIEAKPSAIDDVTEVFGDSAVPLLFDTPGFRGALLLADPHTGRIISQTIWRDPQARAASPSASAVINADVFESAGCVTRAVEDYRLVFSSARKP